MPTQSYTVAGSYLFTVPAAVFSLQIECWGGGSGGGNAYADSGVQNAGGGGGSGAYAKKTISVTPGQNFSLSVGSAGSPTSFAGLCVADGSSPGGSGNAVTPGTGGAGGLASNSVGDITTSGASGAAGSGNSSAGAAGAVNGGAGGNAPNGGAGGAGGTVSGWSSGGGWSATVAQNGTAPGGGAGGGAAAYDPSGGTYTNSGGTGANGEVLLTWSVESITGSGASTTSPGATGTGNEIFAGSGSGKIASGATGTGGETFLGSGRSTGIPAGTGTGWATIYGSGVSVGIPAGSGTAAEIFSGPGTGSVRPAGIGIGAIGPYTPISGESSSYPAGTGTAVTIDVQASGTSEAFCASTGSAQALPPGVGSTAYYINLFTSEYKASTRLLSWCNANLNLFQDFLSCLENFETGFDLSFAVGPQLDVLGRIIGASRTVGFQPSNGYSPVLDDATYRVLLQAKVAQNHWDGKLDSLMTIWQGLFPGGILIVNDLQNMTVNLYVAGAFTSLIQDLILNGYIIPRPQGVLYNISLAQLPMFGFDRSDQWVAGFDVGHFT